ncbi:MAG TPA: tryptophanase [Myxococcota bacterium]|nr:tryptophanase [Myxococcota bacterium]HQK52591.1 tryptophanase [Myxococcota bacterium]
MSIRTIIEPFRIKMVEPIRMTSREERQAILERAGYNPFLIPAEDVLLDLLTDSGTSAMSSEQWAAMMRGDESYAGARSFTRFADVVKRLTGLGQVIPTHQGRAAERILFGVVGGPGKVIPNNTHFDTTRANIEHVGAEAVDLVSPQGLDPTFRGDFKGDMDVPALERLIEQVGPERIPLVMVTVTNNAAGGQPVSMGNLRAVRAVCDRYRLPLFLDAARFAENCWFIREREAGYGDRPLREVAREMFSLCDGLTMSAKKDALVNIGGFLAMNDPDLADRCRSMLILTEGFPTYGGLAGRDLEAMAQGLQEVLDEDYMRYRIRSVAFLGEHLVAGGVPIFEPPGGHAIYIDARRFLPHIPPEQFPGQALVGALYLEGGVRSVEVGSVMFGRWAADGRFIPARNELVRLAIPRRVYTQSHIEYLIEVVLEVFRKRDQVRGLRFRREAQVLRHFTSTFEPVS